jgi:hypothetical protein
MSEPLADMSKILPGHIDDWLFIEIFNKAIMTQPELPLAEWTVIAVSRKALKPDTPVTDAINILMDKNLRALICDKAFRVNIMANPDDPKLVGVKVFFLGGLMISWDTIGHIREIVPDDWAHRGIAAAIQGPSQIIKPDPKLFVPPGRPGSHN